ncbi:NEL-type E3 ubiquitin ligase domain-containing protein [Pectobacterium brasiliense]|uniref:NEL-type E3 ubiquitin ligase domain-containing protein n=1 Tax=Pectobacterium brasiliense TaxID=180957 RepID=UPI0019699414|nr:NEL-type E3 ubiquitin ligase domain-containing protein [Pectobacterium brasiliense]MBN3261883.1 hypothetical protein [Pectobacterium brasiliense]
MPNFNISPTPSHATTNSCRINNVRDPQHQSNDDSLWPKMKEWFPQSNQSQAETLLRKFYQPATEISQRERLFNFIQLKTLLSPEYQNNLVTERLDGKGETVCTIVPSGNDAPTPIALTLSEDDHNAGQGLIALHKWVCASPDGEAEKRHVAAKYIQACWKNNLTSLNLANLELTTLPDTLPQGITYLNVENNSLTTLPALPQSITHLYVRDNILTTLPASLPQETTHLDVSDNPLTALPDTLPKQIVALYARNNILTTLPASLPQEITRLNISNNILTTLPASLPQKITYLDVSDNRLETLPVSLPQEITHLDVSNNRLETLPAPLPQGITYLNASYNQLISTTLHYISSLLIQEYIIAGNPPPQQRLLEAFVKDWQLSSISGKWATFNDEQHAPAFSAFLDKLRQTKTATTPTAFGKEVSDWLTQLANDGSLREKTFLIAMDATASCNDRVLVTYHQMKQAEIAHRAESGEYDNDLPKLLNVGRKLFRIEQLEHIARDKVRQLNATTYAKSSIKADEIEVFLGYQHKLRDKLELTTSAAPEMIHFKFSNITEDELNKAEHTVKEKENDTFPAWFAQWSPWHKTAERLAPEEWKKANDDKQQHYEETFNKLVQTELRPAGIDNDNDAIQIIGVRAKEEAQKNAFESMTHRVLVSKFSDKFFTPRWKLKTASK